MMFVTRNHIISIHWHERSKRKVSVKSCHSVVKQTFHKAMVNHEGMLSGNCHEWLHSSAWVFYVFFYIFQHNHICFFSVFLLNWAVSSVKDRKITGPPNWPDHIEIIFCVTLDIFSFFALIKVLLLVQHLTLENPLILLSLGCEL